MLELNPKPTVLREHYLEDIRDESLALDLRSPGCVTTRQIQIRFPRIKITRQSGEQRWNGAGLIFTKKSAFQKYFFRISISINERILNPKNLGLIGPFFSNKWSMT